MPGTLVVHAHPEPRAFTAQWAEASAAAAARIGHTVLRSDLCGMGFDPVEHPRHYPPSEGRFDPLRQQSRATASGTLPPDVAAEIEKIRAAETLILHSLCGGSAPPRS